MTPRDDYAFVGDPPMFRPPASEVHVSCTFTWDIAEAHRLANAWNRYYPTFIGGCAARSPADEFTPGMYVRQGIAFTSRGCNNYCPWCFVPEREGKIREIPIRIGNEIQDNNLLQCSRTHIAKVFDMLRSQRDIRFSGGLEARLITSSIADDIRSLKLNQLFTACDAPGALKPLERARRLLTGFNRNQLRCYVLVGFGNDTVSQAEARLEQVWELGFMPFVQLYQPSNRIDYSKEWHTLARTWSRPAAMVALHREIANG